MAQYKYMAGSREISSRETQKSSNPPVSTNTEGEKWIQWDTKAVAEKLTKLIEKTDSVLVQALDDSQPLEKRTRLINHPAVKELMALFQETKKSPQMKKYTDISGKQIDKLYEKFQGPLREYAFSQKEKLLTKLHKEENTLRVSEQKIAQNGMKNIEKSVLWFDGDMYVW